MSVLLQRQLTERPHEAAVVDQRGELTWRELADRVRGWSRAFAGAGLGVGDTVGAVMSNRREVFEILLACLHSGITVVPINQHLTTPEIAYLLADSRAAGLVTDRARWRVAEAAVEQSGVSLRLFTQVDEPPPGAPDPPAPCCGQLMVYTAGTTGTPKGVLNGLFNTGDPFDRVERLLRYADRVLGVPSDGRVLLVGPWYHSAQLFFALTSLLHGSTVVVREWFDAGAVLDLLERERISHSHLVPTQFVRLLRLDEQTRRGFDPRALRRIWHGGMACSTEVKRRMIEWWGPVFAEYYGASEGGAVTLIDSAQWWERPGSVGRPIPPNQLLIVDNEGHELPPGIPGKVYIRRPGRGFAYHNDDQKTAAAYLRPGVFTYGEVGYLDEDGYLFLTGRTQDMIVTGGVNVYAAEVEAVLLRHPAVRDVAVVGVPDDEFGERVAALVELEHPGMDAPWRELDRHCRTALAGFKVPRHYQKVGSLPRESTGKLRKQLLRELVAP